MQRDIISYSVMGWVRVGIGWHRHGPHDSQWNEVDWIGADWNRFVDQLDRIGMGEEAWGEAIKL